MRPRPARIATSAVVATIVAAAVLSIPGTAAAVPVCTASPADLTGLGVAGDGTPESPFLIATAAQLVEVGDSDHRTCAFRQVADIDLTGSSFGPIGSSGSPFTGSYDGQRYLIRGLEISRDTYELGMFGVVNGATIERVRIVGGTIDGWGELGAIVGRVGLDSGADASSPLTTIRDVVVSTAVTGAVFSDSVGGLVGQVANDARLEIEDSATYGDVRAGRYAIGGLIGYVRSGASVTVTDSYAAGAVGAAATSNNVDSVGGLVGIGQPTLTITGSSASGAVTAVASGTATLDTNVPQRFGCLIGDRKSASITDTYSTGTLTVGDGATVDCSTATGPPAGFVAGVGFQRPELYAPIGSGDGDGDGGGDAPSGPSYVTTSGLPPTLPPGTGVWQGTDGSETPLEVSSPGVGQVRYSAPGLQLTLTGSSGSGTGSGLVADRDGDVECELCAFLAAGGVIEAWVFSEPRLAAAWRTDEIARVLGELPCRRFTIPVGTPLDGGAGLPPGAHTLQLVLPTTAGLQAVNVGVTVAGPVPGAIPAGDGAASGDVERSVPAGVAVLVMVLSAVALVGRRGAAGCDIA